jgi:L-serine dehydratase
MTVSIFELFKIGIGPSSSHTMGPMTAASRFVAMLRDAGLLPQVERVAVVLYGSLALTGRGHATDTAMITGLHGIAPEQVDPDAAATQIAEVRATHRLMLAGTHPIDFDPERDIVWRGDEALTFHPNGLTLIARDAGGHALLMRSYYSIGGGFVLDEDEARDNRRDATEVELPFGYCSAAEMLEMASGAGLTIAELALANEDARRPRAETLDGIERLFRAMESCIDRGLGGSGILPGGLDVPRRAPMLHDKLRQGGPPTDPLAALDWINLWALAVNEENAGGGRVVTSPTNGAAGIIPAVLRYHDRFHRGTPESRATFLLTAAAIGALYKRNASISAAEVGCQGEVGVACSMAAAGLAAAMGGSNAQIENAAEIGMEHNLGLTCDPIGGLVQIPCIERNAMGAVKAIDAARLALMGDGHHRVSLDAAIDTMRRTGADMKDSYKETSLGGLAVYRPEC